MSGAEGSPYLARRFSCDSQRARRSVRMCSNRTLAGSYLRPSERASSASAGISRSSQAFLRTLARHLFRLAWVRHRCVQPGELRLDLGHDTLLFGQWRESAAGGALGCPGGHGRCGSTATAANYTPAEKLGES